MKNQILKIEKNNINNFSEAPKKAHFSTQRLSSILTSLGLISKDQLNITIKEQENLKKGFAETLITLGFLSEQTLNQVLADYAGFSSIDLTAATLDYELIQKLPRHLAEQKGMLPVAVENNTLLLAMTDVYDIRSLDQARKYYPQFIIKPVLATASALHNAIDRYYGYELSIDKLLKEIENNPQDTNSETSWISPVVRLVETLLLHGIKLKASDIHFQPEETYVRLRYRIDGILQQHCAFHKSYWSSVCVRLKVLAKLNLAESRRPQTGRFSLSHGSREIDFRVSSHPTIHGENIVLRILDKQTSLRSLEDLGFTEEQVVELKEMIKQPQGLFVITGPTGSGKTTTMYSILKYLDSAQRNIMTLEQPVEYQLPMIRQSEINEMTRSSFADGVRSLLRQDPDIIFIGEIRDEDTAQMALRAAMTGHLVFTTLHTNDSLSVISRLRDLGLHPNMTADYLAGAISQRLVRLMCKSCLTQGCETCHHTGYSGRIAVSEVLTFTPALRQAISEGAHLPKLRALAKKSGFKSMREIAQELADKNLTTMEETHLHLGHAEDEHQ